MGCVAHGSQSGYESATGWIRRICTVALRLSLGGLVSLEGHEAYA